MPIYASTEYVFDGTHGAWRETDEPHPSTQYGIQKLEVERRLLADPRRSLIVRLSRVVGTERGTHSVLGPWLDEISAGKTIRCATDQVFSPADVRDIAGALIRLAGSGATGLYHLGEDRSRSAASDCCACCWRISRPLHPACGPLSCLAACTIWHSGKRGR